MITAKRQSQSWAEGDDDWVKKCPQYCDGELIEKMENWAIYVAAEGACKDVARQLMELLCRSPRNYHITGGHFKMFYETDDIFRRVVVDLTLVISDEDDD